MESTKYNIKYVEICDISISLLEELTKSIKRLDIDTIEGVFNYLKLCIAIYEEIRKMNDNIKLDKLKELLKDEIQWFDDNIHDEDYVYDECFQQFSKLKRTQCYMILSLLSDKER